MTPNDSDYLVTSPLILLEHVSVPHAHHCASHVSFGARQLASVDCEVCVCVHKCSAMEEYFEEIAAVAGEIDDAVEDEEGTVCRLPYIVRQRQDPMHFYDDGEFVQKLCMSKRTVAMS